MEPCNADRHPSAVDETLEKEKQVALREAAAFVKVHFRSSVCLQFLSFVAFGVLLTVESIVAMRADDKKWIMDLSLLGTELYYQDEVLTQSARLLALTGDIKWRDTYLMWLKPHETTLDEIADQVPDISAEFEDTCSTAADSLIAMEDAAMELSMSNASQAAAVLFSNSYVRNKSLMFAGIATLNHAIEAKQVEYNEVQSWWKVVSVILVVVCLLINIFKNVGTAFIDRKLFKKTLAADNAWARAKQEYQSAFKDRVQKATLFCKSVVGESEFREVEKISERFSKQIVPEIDDATTVFKRAVLFGIIIDLIGTAAIMIPLAFTITALVRADYAQELQETLRHVRMIEYYEFGLSSSARLCALTGDEQWRLRYYRDVVPLKEEINSLSTLEPDLAAKFLTPTSVAANDALLKMEADALSICVSSPLTTKAKQILFGDAYKGNKSLLLSGIAELRAEADVKDNEHTQEKEAYEGVTSAFMIASAMTMLPSNVLRVILSSYLGALARQAKRNIRDMDKFENTMMDGVGDLISICMANMCDLKRQIGTSSAIYPPSKKDPGLVKSIWVEGLT